MNKPTKKTMSIMDIVVDFDLNIRKPNNYDIASMVEQIRVANRILTPIFIRGEDNKALRGNRRTLAGQQIFMDKTSSQELIDSLKKVDVLVYTGLTPGEELALILDQGGEKPIARSEILSAVWRMSKNFFSETEIILQMYFVLARYTGREKKLLEVNAITRDADRKKALHDWFHGSVGNYMLKALTMGDFVVDQMMLTHLAEDGLLLPDQRVTAKMSRDRIGELSKAKTYDEKEGQGWVYETGGETFNAKLEQYKAQDAGTETKEKKSRPSVKELTDKASIFKSPLIRKAFLLAAGVDSKDTQNLTDDDALWVNDDRKKQAIVKAMPNLPEPYATFAASFLHNSPAKFAEYLESISMELVIVG